MISRFMQQMSIPTLAWCALVAGTGLRDVAQAQRAHNADLYIRASVGPAFAQSVVSSIDTSERFELAGEGVAYSLALGAITVPNWAVHVSFYGWNTFSPDPRYDTGVLNPKATLSMFAWGAGVTYIWMPINVYFSLSPAFSQLRTKGPGIADARNDVGWAVEGSIGKEWWLSDTTAWGFAISGSYHEHRSAVIVDRKWNGYSVSARLSITSN